MTEESAPAQPLEGEEPKKDRPQREEEADLDKLMKRVLGKNGVRTRHAAEVGRRAIDYFRGRDFVKWVKANAETLEAEVPFFAQLLENGDVDAAAVSAGQELLSAGFVYRAKPATNEATSSKKEGDASPSEKSNKWPKKLQAVKTTLFDEKDSFYVIAYEGSKFGSHAMLGLIILSVLIVCMFPAWPFAMKLATWYISVVLLTFILFIVVLRLILFVFLWFFGMDFWFIPNLFDEDVGVIESFIPWYSFEYRNDGWMMMVARLFCFVLSCAGIWQLGQTHSISDINQFAKRQFLDVLDWGHQKLMPPPTVGQYLPPGHMDPLMRARTNNISARAGSMPAAEVEEEAEDFSCLRKCGFETYEELADECLSDCHCMEELVQTPCYARCPKRTKDSLDEAKVEICTREPLDEDPSAEGDDSVGGGASDTDPDDSVDDDDDVEDDSDETPDAAAIGLGDEF